MADTPEEVLALAQAATPRTIGFFSTTFPVRRWLASIQIDGEWLLCDDSIVRPVIRGEILDSDGLWVPSAFLVDTGADRTVFSAEVTVRPTSPPVVDLCS